MVVPVVAVVEVVVGDCLCCCENFCWPPLLLYPLSIPPLLLPYPDDVKVDDEVYEDDAMGAALVDEDDDHCC